MNRTYSRDEKKIHIKCLWENLSGGGARGSVVDYGTMLQAGRSWGRVQMRWIFLIDLIVPAAYGPGVDSASNRNEYQEYSRG
jgi:hypothetical protein